MRASVRWIAVAAVGVSACGGTSAQPDGGGHPDGLRFDGLVGTGGSVGGGGASGSGGVDGGRGELPPSTGDFPYPGRWWAYFQRDPADATLFDTGSFVIHWSATDPADRGLWTFQQVYPIAVTAGADGSIVVTHGVPDTTGCWALYPTTDPDALSARACGQPPSSGAPALGTFRRGPQLIDEIPVPPLAPLTVPSIKVPYGGIGGGGDWVAFTVDTELWLWQRETGKLFDVGPGNNGAVALSPDGRRAMFTRAMPAGQIPSLQAFDTVTAETTNLTALAPITAAAQYTNVGVFSPDGSKVAFQVNVSSAGNYSLLLYDFDSKDVVTLAPQLNSTNDFGRQSELFLASSDHLIYTGRDTTDVNAPLSAFGYEVSTGRRLTFGAYADVVAFPGGAHAGLQTGDGVVVIDDATFTPRVLDSLMSGGQFTGGGGIAPSPDGSQVAYVDGQMTLQLRDLALGTTQAISVGAGCLTVADPLAPDHSGASRSVAAFFAGDGAIVHGLSPSCAGGIYGLGRFDRASQTEKRYAQLADDGTILAWSPLGGVVFDGPVPTVLAWPGPAVRLDPTPSGTSASPNPAFTFSVGDRYLTYTSGDTLVVRDNQAGTVTMIGSLGGAGAFTSPVTGVTLVSDKPATAYLPDGTSWPAGLDPNSILEGVIVNPQGTKVILEAGSLQVFSLEPGATAKPIGNGYPIAVTDTQIIFRDVDGVCAAPL